MEIKNISPSLAVCSPLTGLSLSCSNATNTKLHSLVSAFKERAVQMIRLDRIVLMRGLRTVKHKYQQFLDDEHPGDDLMR